jgi:protein SCO1/2
MKRWLPLVAIAFLGILLVWLIFKWDPGNGRGDFAGLEIAPAPQGGDFTLTSANGPVSLEGLRGKVVLLYFGYTWCPDICPTSLAMISVAFRQLTPEEMASVQGVFVSVDPERDTPERLATYTRYFHPAILGVTGTPEEVASVARLYGAGYRKVKQDSATNYVVDHTADIYVIDQQGKLYRTLPHGTPPSEMVAVMRGLLHGGDVPEASKPE